MKLAVQPIIVLCVCVSTGNSINIFCLESIASNINHNIIAKSAALYKYIGAGLSQMAVADVNSCRNGSPCIKSNTEMHF